MPYVFWVFESPSNWPRDIYQSKLSLQSQLNLILIPFFEIWCSCTIVDIMYSAFHNALPLLRIPIPPLFFLVKLTCNAYLELVVNRSHMHQHIEDMSRSMQFHPIMETFRPLEGKETGHPFPILDAKPYKIQCWQTNFKL